MAASTRPISSAPSELSKSSCADRTFSVASSRELFMEYMRSCIWKPRLQSWKWKKNVFGCLSFGWGTPLRGVVQEWRGGEGTQELLLQQNEAFISCIYTWSNMQLLTLFSCCKADRNLKTIGSQDKWCLQASRSFEKNTLWERVYSTNEKCYSLIMIEITTP